MRNDDNPAIYRGTTVQLIGPASYLQILALPTRSYLYVHPNFIFFTLKFGFVVTNTVTI
jgi:hypothetical protein